jgi:hypothetical protein
MPSCWRAPASGDGGQAWRDDHAGGDLGGGEVVWKGPRPCSRWRLWWLVLELGNDDSAMDRRVGVVGRVLHVLASSQGLKGAE